MMHDKKDTIRKVAILVTSVGDELAEELIGKLPPTQAGQVRQALAGLGKVRPQEADQVVREFMRRRSGTLAAQASGVELDGSLVETLSHSRSESSARPTGPSSSPKPSSPKPLSSTDRPFRFLSDADSQSLAPFLEKEYPQTVAVVLSYLPQARAAQVMAALPEELQVDVVRRLANLEETDSESLRVIERELESWMSAQQRSPDRTRSGIDTISGILAAASAADQQIIVGNVRRHDDQLAETIVADQPEAARFDSPPVASIPFENLAQLDPRSLATLVREVDPELMVLALAGASDTLVTRILDQLPPQDVDALRHDLHHLGPIRLSDVETAQNELARLAVRLESEGSITVPHAALTTAA